MFVNDNDIAIIIGLTIHYILFCFLIPACLKKWTFLQHEWIRKIQHIAFGMTVFWIINLSHWTIGLLSLVLVIAFGLPFLLFLEYHSIDKKILVPRKGEKGELRRQLCYAMLMFFLQIIWFWGIWGEDYKYLIVISVMPWMLGDALAAILGKRYGKKIIALPYVYGTKTYIGTLAMFVTSFICLLSLITYYTENFVFSLILALTFSPIITYVELISKKGRDTINVPLITALMLSLGMVYIF